MGSLSASVAVPEKVNGTPCQLALVPAEGVEAEVKVTTGGLLEAWVLMVTILGIPLGVAMLNRLPKIYALREPAQRVRISRRQDGSLVEQEIDQPQVNILLRAIYFILIGWWFSALWMEAAYLLCTTIIGLPLGFWMFDRVPGVLSLKR